MTNKWMWSTIVVIIFVMIFWMFSALVSSVTTFENNCRNAGGEPHRGVCYSKTSIVPLDK